MVKIAVAAAVTAAEVEVIVAVAAAVAKVAEWVIHSSYSEFVTSSRCTAMCATATGSLQVVRPREVIARKVAHCLDFFT